jgi:hemolysin activation/secretion protein
VKDIPLISGPDFAGMMSQHLGQPVKMKTLKQIQREIIIYCRDHDRPLVDVIVPNQDVNPTNGVIQVVLIEGRIGKVTVKNDEPKYFKDEMISRWISLQPGDQISERKLLADIDWLNRNPFREVSPAFRQGEQAGLSDLQLEVEDRFPFRVFAGYEDTGTELTGKDRVLAGFNWGNAFGLDHQINYQYTADIEFDHLMAHSASYIAPLPWKHMLSVYGTYVDIDADLGSSFSDFESSALNYQTAVRYSVPLPFTRRYQHEAFVGVDYKHNENDLLFRSSGSSTPITDTETDVLQLALGYTGTLSDRWGRTSFGLQGFLSPGGLVGKNDDDDFNAQHSGANSDYIYGRLSVERVTRLPWDFSLVLRASGQAATGNLIPSEQLGVGGYNTVRGYDEREINGDRGLVLNGEIRTPPIRLIGRYPKTGLQDQLQFLGFWDYGLAENVDPLESESTTHLHSVGGGVRYTINRYLAARFDYAYRLRGTDIEGTEGEDTGSRVHVGVVVSY